MDGIANLYIPLCGLFIAILCNIVFFSKERVKNKETNIFSRVLIYSLVDSILMVLIMSLAIFHNNNLALLEILNKADYAMYVLYSSNFFLYVYYVTFKSNENNKIKIYNIFFYLTTAIDIAFIILLLFMKVNVHIDGNIMYSDGMSLSSTIICCTFYFIAIIACLIINLKKAISRKLTPLYVLIGFFALVLVLNQVDKTIVIISAVLAYVNLIMLFTIENPDVNMINELALAKNQAEKANRAKSDFISSMSHEIRTPLNAIVGFSEFIQTEKDPKEIEADAKNILISSQNLLEIVNGILDISKIEAEKMEITETEYELMPILENLSDLMIPRIGDKEIELKTDFTPDIPKNLYGDKIKVKQIITNLLTNAVKYTEKGIITFKVNCINQNDKCILRIVVSDTGRGIKKEQMDKLFTKFQRLDEDKNTTIEGTGLGLAITKSLVEMMGGNINVQSVYGSGSVFTVNLSQKIVYKTINDTEERINKVIDFSNKKILVVDDNNLNLLVANKMLKEYKINTTLVTSGFDCINRIEDKEYYDLILMDDMMPKMSGKDTFKKLKENKDFNIPVVILTANAIKGMKENYISIGFNDYLSKPIDKNELEKILIKYLSNNITQTKLLEEKHINENIKEEKPNIEDLSNKKVLIVDDNNVNIKVASNMLNVYNFKIYSVTSGRECIDKIKNNEHFDLILMDDMMPELSGLETLKELKGISDFNVPVVSLTANKEFSNTREYYLDLGFDEYIEKPIDKKNLDNVINKLLKISKPLTEKGAKQNINTEKGNVDYLKNNGINIDASLELLGDINMYNETLNMFIEENKKRIPRIEENKNIDNMKDYAIDVHALKSDSKYLGFKKLAEISYDHELKSKENNIGYVNEHYKELMEEYNRIDSIIKKYI